MLHAAALCTTTSSTGPPAATARTPCTSTTRPATGTGAGAATATASARGVAILLGDLALVYSDRSARRRSAGRPRSCSTRCAWRSTSASTSTSSAPLRASDRLMRRAARARRWPGPGGSAATRRRNTPSSGPCTSGRPWPRRTELGEMAGPLSAFGLPLGRGLPAARRPARRVRRSGRYRETGRRRPEGGQADAARLPWPRRRRPGRAPGCSWRASGPPTWTQQRSTSWRRK